MRKIKKCGIYENYFRELSKFDLLCAEEEIELGKKIEKGCEKSRHKLILCNLRLVIPEAQKFNNFMPMMDLIQEGNLGLISCVDKFNYRFGFKFSSYAVVYIQKWLLNTIYDNYSLLRIPRHVCILMNKVRKITLELTQKLGKEPSEKYVLKQLGLKNVYIPKTKVLETDSLDFDINEKIDTENKSHMDVAELDSLNSRILKIFKSLDEKEQFVLRLYFGIGLDKSYTLDQIGKIKGNVKQRILQIKSKALKKLKNNKSFQELRIFTN